MSYIRGIKAYWVLNLLYLTKKKPIVKNYFLQNYFLQDFYALTIFLPLFPT